MEEFVGYAKDAAVAVGCLASATCIAWSIQMCVDSGMALLEKYRSRLQSGIVIEKRCEAPEKSYGCVPGPAIVPPTEILRDEAYAITFAPSTNGRVLTRTVYIKKEDYNSLDLGQRFDASTYPPIRPRVREFFGDREVGR